MSDDNKKRPLHQFDISRLKNSTDEVIKDRSLSEGFKNGGVVKGTAPAHDYQKTIVKNVPVDRIDTRVAQPLLKGNEHAEKIARMLALKHASKKAMSVLPFAGAAYGLMSGDPAMAAEEAMGDVPVFGHAYEAFKPEDAGNVEEERQMIAERDARVAYDKSPARLARLAALKKMGQ